MLQASTAYKLMMNSPIRERAYISVSLGVLNQDAQADVKVHSNLAPWSKGNIFEQEKPRLVSYATMEQNQFALDGSMTFMPEDEQYLENGIVSADIGGSIHLDFGSTYAIKGLTIDFGNTYPTEFTIETDNGTYTYENNDNVFVTEEVFGVITYMTITPVTMVGGAQRLRIISVLMGVGLSFTNTTTENASVEQFISSVSLETSYIDVKLSLWDTEDKFNVDNEESFMKFLEPRQPIKVSFGVDLEDGTQEWKQVASVYLKEWSSEKGKLNIVAVDRLSQLDSEYEHNVLEERTAYEEFERIFADAGLEPEDYSIDEYLYNITIKNPIEKATHKECLQVLANACRCIIFENENGMLYVRANFENVVEPEELTVTTNGATDYSIPVNVVNGTEVTNYADMSANAISVDGNTLFMPESSDDYLSTMGYTSTMLADENGEFETEPTLTITLPALFTYYGVRIEWGNPTPQEFVIETYRNGTLKGTWTITDVEKVTSIFEDFSNFNEMRIRVTKTEPHARVRINQVSFGYQTDYRITKDLMLGNPKGYQEDIVKEVRVKVYTYEMSEGENPEPQLVDDNVYYTETLNLKGLVKTVENPLIHTMEQAQAVAEWMGNYFKNNVSYSLDFRGEPRLQAGDIIRMDNDFKNNMSVEVEKNTLTFNGAFKGNVDLRRALKLMS